MWLIQRPHLLEAVPIVLQRVPFPQAEAAEVNLPKESWKRELNPSSKNRGLRIPLTQTSRLEASLHHVPFAR